MFFSFDLLFNFGKEIRGNKFIVSLGQGWALSGVAGGCSSARQLSPCSAVVVGQQL
jgi:hypothetical protein